MIFRGQRRMRAAQPMENRLAQRTATGTRSPTDRAAVRPPGQCSASCGALPAGAGLGSAYGHGQVAVPQRTWVLTFAL